MTYLPLDEEAAVEFEDVLAGAGVGWDDAGVGDLFTANGLALAGGDLGVLDVQVVGIVRTLSGPGWRRRGP